MEAVLTNTDVSGDRNDLNLQKGGDKLIQEVAKNCGKGNADVIVVIHTVGPVILESFVDIPNIKAILIANLPGQESGNALVDVLFGAVNPSGRLPYTIAKAEDDYGPGSKVKYSPSPLDGLSPQQNFSEGMYIDYRYFDKNDIAPRYEFGYGLSYTTFSLTSLLITSHGPKTPLPALRPSGIEPPTYSTDIPDPSTALYPKDFHKVEKYVYPYIASTSDIHRAEDIKTNLLQSPLSPAGGAQGGNPDLYITLLTVSATVTNIGARDGDCVVQLYISLPKDYTDPASGEPIDFPVRVLRGFEKVSVAAQKEAVIPGIKGSTHGGGGGNSVVVEFEVTRKDVSYWDVRRQNWVVPSLGEVVVEVGFSSRDLPLKGTW